MLFAVNLLFRSIRDGVFNEADLWEESIILIKADSEEEAHVKAAEMGKSREASYTAIDGGWVTWAFFKIERVFEIQDYPLKDGSELFSRHLKNSEVESILASFEND